ncbi:hypothetical protein [Streptomyces lavendulae]|uniref:hypothetical protein n=1 Tax=Streptomyces lavendulae TaxID=1914 RepID=UPI0024A37F4D|nr:hypothetical protein [Streptomyces lavendulae]GLX17767.1 hypothetical protein Slala01_14110 [Streptomyces lavendulae subsp. lavendulae]GLX26110.1 hypothetical protein Slala02_19300 [Streptomyces lavendulae subsp. lavendulae]
MSDSSVQVATVVISVAALVLSTTAAFWALVYNRRQARAVAQANALTEKAQREQAEPYVIVDIRPRIPGSSLLVLVIENIGQTLARNVRISVNPPLQTTLGSERAATLNRAVSRPIATLPPKRRIPFVMDMGHRLFSSELPKIYEFRVEADGPFGRVDPLIYTVDLEALRDSALETDSVEWSTHQIAKDLKRSADAQEEQSRSIEALSSEVRKRLGRRSPEQASGVEVSEVVEPALSEIPMRPLSDDGVPT